MFPKDTDGLSWSKYKKATFDNLLHSQGADGGWTGRRASACGRRSPIGSP